jgi:pyruvate kinase
MPSGIPAPSLTPTPQHLDRLIRELDRLVASAHDLEGELAHEIERVLPAHRASARNLVHYLALRQQDRRDLQDELAELGLSSLGRLEPHVLASIDAVRVALHRLAGRRTAPPDPAASPLPFRAGAPLLVANAEALLGVSPEGRSVRVMVTMPSEAAGSPDLVRELLAAGMDVMRINCAHDDRHAWGRMVSLLRRAESDSGRRCRVLCDLAGPKLRTGGLAPGPGILHFWPLRDDAGRVLRPAQIGCTLPAAFEEVRPGHRILFDDGKIGGVVREASPGRLQVEITQARSGKGKLRGDRGINLPDTTIRVPAITAKDREDLDFVARHADMVGLSFLRSAEDVEALLAELDARRAARLGVVLKIETQRAFDELPRVLLAALRCERVGVMVARGDLGVELGFSRLAEVQEEILWLCEACHVPVIWATQVLESLAKKGMPSRAEVTDAAMGGRAECVMLNKGPHVGAAVRFLCDVLQRMEGHQEKKRSLLRRLQVSRLR